MVRAFTSSEGVAISVGESAAENDALVKKARQNDLWFHVDNAPSPHVILHCGASGGADKLRRSVLEAAMLCKLYSKSRDAAQTRIIFVTAKHVSKRETYETAGLVSLTKSPSSMTVACDEAVLAQLGVDTSGARLRGSSGGGGGGAGSSAAAASASTAPAGR